MESSISELPKEPVLFDPAIIQNEVIKALTHPDVKTLLLEVFRSASSDNDSKFEKTAQKFDQIDARYEALGSKLNDLADVVKVQAETILKQTARIEELEQYGRRNGVRISGIPEKDTRGNSIPWMLNWSKTHLGLNIPPGGISRMHRVGKPGTKEAPLTRPRAILVKFSTYQLRREALFQNKFLRSATNPDSLPNVFLSEDLSRQRERLRYLASQAYRLHKIDASWTMDGTIITDLNGTVKRWTEEDGLTEYLGGLPVRAKKTTPAAAAKAAAPVTDPEVAATS